MSVEECRLVHDELVRRGLKAVATEEEYKAGVAEHGVPPAFAKAGALHPTGQDAAF